MIGNFLWKRCILSMVVLLSIFSTATAKDAEITITAVPLTKQIYMLAGNGGNIGLFIGVDGTFLIDDQYAPLTEKIVAAIKSVGGDSPQFLINTHYHGDHTGGNEKLGERGALIFSHDNVRERLKTGSYINAFKMKRPSVSQAGLPVVTFSEDITFHINGDTVQAIHVSHAHTDGDSFIHFKKANVIHAGDFFFNGFYPFIDVTHGGSLKGMIQAVEKVLSMADSKTQIVAGHGPMGNKEQLFKYHQMLSTAFERLRKLKADGKSAQEAAATNPLADLEAEWGDGLFKGNQWIELIYSGI